MCVCVCACVCACVPACVYVYVYYACMPVFVHACAFFREISQDAVET